MLIAFTQTHTHTLTHTHTYTIIFIQEKMIKMLKIAFGCLHNVGHNWVKYTNFHQINHQIYQITNHATLHSFYYVGDEI